ncbi:MAG: hypothetical protein VYC32_10315 [Planctomycetota bacterium]|nr:hypothetical protein [Planctomycetota bacterium]MEE3297890.1 hypothetical protein [Planctomycetota bacterium]
MFKTNPAALALALLSAVSGFERTYIKQAVLTEEEEQVVISLAKKRGIEKIAKISTFYLRPTAARGISVQGVEEFKGREVSFKVLNVTYREWTFPNAKPGKRDLQMGDFWAGPAGTRKQTILKVNKKEYRVASPQGIEIKECESILALFLAGKYTANPGVNAEQLKQVNWKKPGGFWKRGERLSVQFPHKREGNGFFDLQVEVGKKQLVITQLLQAIP